ncbi:MAG: hypothetical protein KAR38_01160, partial [Calditrichia bacterium]|nr:hypothetical protein [Calditrichia bacterium]
FLFISGISLYQDYTNPTREPWREVTNDLKMHCDKNDLVLVGADYCYYGPVKYYLKDHNLNTFAISNRSFPEDSLQTIVHNYYKNGGKNIWFVSSHFNNYEKTVLKLLEQNYLLKKKNPYSYMDFYGRNKTVITIYNFKVK